MPMLTLTHGAVRYAEVGDGPPLLALHANLHDSADYAGVAAALAREHRLITLDWPGHGCSPAPEKPLTAAQLGDLAVEFVDRLGLTSLMVIGNSVGGYAACRIAIEQDIHRQLIARDTDFAPLIDLSRCLVGGRQLLADWDSTVLEETCLAEQDCGVPYWRR